MGEFAVNNLDAHVSYEMGLVKRRFVSGIAFL